jgi:hypothetical protein
MREEQIVDLQNEIKRLSIKLETLVNYLNVSGTFGPPYGRDAYDAKVKSNLAGAGL